MNLLAPFGLQMKKRGPISADDQADADETARILAAQGPALTDHHSDTNPIRTEYLTTRVLMAIVGVETTVIVMLLLAILEMVPLHTVEPYFVTFQDANSQIVTIAPPTQRISSMTLIANQYVREYMRMRYEILPDRADNEYRWNTRIRILSSQSVYANFQQEIADIPSMEQKQGLLRQIVIRNILQLRDNTFQVEFDLIDHYNATGIGDAPEKQTSYTAILTMGFFAQSIPRVALALNPFGFRVTAYTVAANHT